MSRAYRQTLQGNSQVVDINRFAVLPRTYGPGISSHASEGTKLTALVPAELLHDHRNTDSLKKSPSARTTPTAQAARDDPPPLPNGRKGDETFRYPRGQLYCQNMSPSPGGQHERPLSLGPTRFVPKVEQRLEVLSTLWTLSFGVRRAPPP